jgi:hypothetical protein
VVLVVDDHSAAVVVQVDYAAQLPTQAEADH